MKNKLDCLLRERQPLPDAPQDLHESIMQAARENRPEFTSQKRKTNEFSLSAWPRLGYGLAVFLGIGTVAFFLVNHASNWHKKPAVLVSAPDLAITAKLQETWSLFSEVGSNPIAFAFQPITQQLDQISADLRKAPNMILASLPISPDIAEGFADDAK